ncbi:MAG TPA: metalloregulator ArsR/SmtB family transcription factor [Candidatus Saccharimonadales bacterium]|nr:metalloregulator ArsR/SmtB family transcription factor [Candidatus Saccharimonadales bacterium]
MLSLDSVFTSLADPTRRDILKRVSLRELSVSEIARPYDLTFAAISKHLKVLEQAQLIVKRKRGKERMVQLAPGALNDATEYLEWYGRLLKEQYRSLDNYISKES